MNTKRMTVKVQCARVTRYARQPGQQNGHENVRFEAAYDPSVPGEERLAEMTPSGHFEVNLSNPALLDVFQPGQYYTILVQPWEEAIVSGE